MRREVIAFRCDHPSTSFHDAIKFAEKRFSDNEQQREFLQELTKVESNARRFTTDVERIWPERKGY